MNVMKRKSNPIGKQTINRKYIYIVKCIFHLPQILLPKNVYYLFKKSAKKKRSSMFHRKRIIFMRKRRKLVKSYKSDCDKSAQILHLEELICDSHTQEKLHDEEIAVTKIKADPNYSFRNAKKA